MQNKIHIYGSSEISVLASFVLDKKYLINRAHLSEGLQDHRKEAKTLYGLLANQD